jgi:hypothetical protein
VAIKLKPALYNRPVWLFPCGSIMYKIKRQLRNCARTGQAPYSAEARGGLQHLVKSNSCAGLGFNARFYLRHWHTPRLDLDLYLCRPSVLPFVACPWFPAAKQKHVLNHARSYASSYLVLEIARSLDLAHVELGTFFILFYFSNVS